MPRLRWSVATALLLPMLLGQGAYTDIWEGHLYAVGKQASYVRQHLSPTFFDNSVKLGWFYP